MQATTAKYTTKAKNNWKGIVKHVKRKSFLHKAGARKTNDTAAVWSIERLQLHGEQAKYTPIFPGVPKGTEEGHRKQP